MADSTAQLKSDIDLTRDHLGETLTAIGDKVSPGRIVERRVDRVKQGMVRVREQVMGVAETGTDATRSGAQAVSSAAGHATEAVADAAGTVAETVGGIPDQVQQRTQGNPLAAGAVAFGLGVIIASVIPTSDLEARAVEDLAEPVRQELQGGAREVVETARDAAQEAVSTTEESVGEAAGEIRDQTAEAAGDITGTAKEAAKGVAPEGVGAEPSNTGRTM